MKKDSYYILTLPLETQRWQEDILAKRYRVAENIYNAMLRRAYTRYRQMCQTRLYRDLRQRLTETSDEKVRKEIYRSLDQLAKQYSLGKFELSRDATPYRRYFKESIDSPVNQNLAANVWKAIRTIMIGRGRKVAYKKPGELLSLSGKTNDTSIRYKNGVVLWKGLVLPVRFRKNSEYETAAMKNQIRLCHLKRQKIHDRWHYYVDLVFSGVAPVKPGGRIQKSGKVGIDIGTRQLIAVTDNEVKLFDLPASYEHYRNQINELKSYMYRSAYQTNPNNFDSNGNVRHGNLKWYYSKKYQKAKEKRKELYRKLTAVRKQDYCVLSHKIIQMGDQILIRDFSSSKEHKKTEISVKKKVNYFYSGRLPTFAPGTLLQTLQYKVNIAGGSLYRFDIQKLREGMMEQKLNPTLDSDCWETVQDYGIRQDVYNAFLLSHTDIHNETINLSECYDNFQMFIQFCQKWQNNLNETLHILKISGNNLRNKQEQLFN